MELKLWQIILLLITGLGTCLALLLWLRHREAQRIERARQAIIISDAINKLEQSWDSLQRWLPEEAVRFITTEIIRLETILHTLNVEIPAAATRASTQALEWQDKHQKSKGNFKEAPPFPAEIGQAKLLRKHVNALLDTLRNCYYQRLIDQEQARDLALEFKMLKGKILLAAFHAQAQTAIDETEYALARKILHKASQVLKLMPEIPITLETRHVSLKETLQQQLQLATESGNRLEDETSDFLEEESKWENKRY